MDVDKLCLHCMKERRSTQGPCPHCGFDSHSYVVPNFTLPLETILHGRYLLGTLSYQKPQSFVYQGYDLVENKPVLVEEFFDPRIMDRAGNGLDIRFNNNYKDKFQADREAFQNNALENGKTCFKENHTYYVIEGISAAKEKSKEKKRGKNASWLTPLLAGAGGFLLAIVLILVMYRAFFLKRNPSSVPTIVAQGLTSTPTPSPTATEAPTPTPTEVPTPTPTEVPTLTPTEAPTLTQTPTETPIPASSTPTIAPKATDTPIPTVTEAPAVNQGSDYSPGTTVMVYMVGSNLETNNSVCTADIQDMLASRLDTSVNHVLVMAGGAKRWWMKGISSSYTGIYELDVNKQMVKEVDGGKLRNMGEADTLSYFINFCTDHYPADHYGLILYDHGLGPVGGFGADELFTYKMPDVFNNAEENETLYLYETKEALDHTIFTQQRLDWVFYNACLMQSLELADLWNEYADYLLASQEPLYVECIDFHCLGLLNLTSDPVQIMEGFRKAYCERMQAEKDESDVNMGFHQELLQTLSCLDLNKISYTVAAYNDLMERILSDLENGAYSEIARLREKCRETMLLECVYKEDRGDLIDLIHMSELFSQAYPAESSSLEKCAKECILFNESDQENLNGISVYSPFNSLYFYVLYDAYMKDRGFVSSKTNEAFATLLLYKMYNESGLDWGLEDVGYEGGNLVLSLDQAHAEETLDVYYSVFRVWDDGTVTPILKEMQLEEQEKGKYVIPSRQELLTVVYNEEGDSVVVPLRQVTKGKRLEQYQTDCMYLTSGENVEDTIYFDDNFMSLYVDFYVDRDMDTEGVICYTGDLGSRTTISFEELASWPCFVYLYEFFKPENDENGNMLPYDEWAEANGYKLNSVDNEGYVGVAREMLSDREEKYVFQFVVEDIYGIRHATSLIEKR